MQKWEYKEIRDASESTLNQLGADGWELVAVMATHADHPAYYVFYFKRLKN
jgi:hypothetical protein